MRSVKTMLAAAAFAMALPAAAADSDPLASYYGVWVGVSAEAAAKKWKRQGTDKDINLLIRQVGDGFEVRWKPLGESGREDKMSLLGFVPTGEDHTYELTRSDPPLAHNAKATIEVEAGAVVISVTEVGTDGKEHVTRFERMVAGDHMTETYTVTEDGEEVRSVTENLARFQL